MVEEVEEVGGVDRGSRCILAGESLQHVMRSWGCSQVDNELEERHASDWLMDDQTMRQWEEVGNDEEETAVKKNEGRKTQVE